MNKFPAPWRVYKPQFDARIVQIVDSNGHVVIPWRGFDQTGLLHTQQKWLANRIVKAINAQERKGGAA